MVTFARASLLCKLLGRFLERIALFRQDWSASDLLGLTAVRYG